MAGFGSVSLTQTAVGALLDQRAIVLYEQPEIDNKEVSSLSYELWGEQFIYNELFSGLLAGTGVERVANVAGANPYGISYMSAKVNIESDLCDHPVEDGTIITDASIVLPVSAEVEVAMPTLFAERIYAQMEDLFKQKKKKIILQTKYAVYKNLVLQNIEYELEHNTIDRTKFILTLREIQEVSTYGDFNNVASAENISNGSDATTINTGTQIAGE